MLGTNDGNIKNEIKVQQETNENENENEKETEILISKSDDMITNKINSVSNISNILIEKIKK